MATHEQWVDLLGEEHGEQLDRLNTLLPDFQIDEDGATAQGRRVIKCWDEQPVDVAVYWLYEEHPTDPQLDALEALVTEDKADFRSLVHNAVFAHCADRLNEFVEVEEYLEQMREEFPAVRVATSPADLLYAISEPILTVDDCADKSAPEFQVSFEVAWDPEHGVGIWLKRVDARGQPSDAWRVTSIGGSADPNFEELLEK